MMTVSGGRVLFANLFCSWTSVAVYSYTVVQSALNKDISIQAETFQMWISFIEGTRFIVTLRKKRGRDRKVILLFFFFFLGEEKKYFVVINIFKMRASQMSVSEHCNNL